MLRKSARKTLFLIGLLTTFLLFCGQLWLNMRITGKVAFSPSADNRNALLYTQPPLHLPQHPLLTPTVTPTATLCPQATPELLAVEPVISPIHSLSETVNVFIGNGEAVTITAESGIFTTTRGRLNSYPVVVKLLLNSTHHLSVAAKVKIVAGPNGCMYGGYTLHTTQDRLGHPLVIVQQSALFFPLVLR